MTEPVIYKDLGIISYEKAWSFQQRLQKELIDRKRSNRHTFVLMDCRLFLNGIIFCFVNIHLFIPLGKSGSM